MPLHLEPRDVSRDLENQRSVLLVDCPVCPPMSLAMQTETPFVQLFKRGLKTKAFEDYAHSVREPLERRGVRTGVFSAHLPCPMMCVWTEGQRNRLRRRARDYDAVLVLACDSATRTAKDALKNTDCEVIQGMRQGEVVNATTKIRWPLTVEIGINKDPEQAMPHPPPEAEVGPTG